MDKGKNSGSTATAVEPTRNKEEARPLDALSRTKALARIAQNPTDWLVQKVIALGDYGVLAGPKGVGKTFALEDLGVSVALGDSWFRRYSARRQRVLLLTAEDSEARTWARIDAIARSKNRKPASVEGWMFVHPFPFSAIKDLARLELEMARWPRVIEDWAAKDVVIGDDGLGLVMLDPAYKYMAGAQSSQLFDMGAVLTPIQQACADVGAALVVGHHYNRREGASREERLSGAGLLEWGRFIITVEAPPRREDEDSVVASFEVTGNSLDPLAFRIKRTVRPEDKSANPSLFYEVQVLDEGAEARRKGSGRKTPDLILDRVPFQPDAATVKEIEEALVADGTPIKEATIRRRLNELSADERVLNLTKDGTAGRWARPVSGE